MRTIPNHRKSFGRVVKDLPYSSVSPGITANMIDNKVGAIVALFGTINQIMNSFVWSAFAIYLLIGLGLAYFQFIAQAK